MASSSSNKFLDLNLNLEPLYVPEGLQHFLDDLANKGNEEKLRALSEYLRKNEEHMRKLAQEIAILNKVSKKLNEEIAKVREAMGIEAGTESDGQASRKRGLDHDQQRGANADHDKILETALTITQQVEEKPGLERGHEGPGLKSNDLALVEAQPDAKGKKKRFKWTPDLHNMFEASVDTCGGLDVPTPSLIRNQMEAQGMEVTASQVKSYLQVDFEPPNQK